MRLLAHGASLAASTDRVRLALGGVAARGHDVRWLGAGAPAWEGVTAITSPPPAEAWAPELVLAGADAASGGTPRLDPGALVLDTDVAAATAPDSAHPDVDALERACERRIAEAAGRAGAPAVFFDRDGTLIVEHGYLGEPERVELLPGVADALRRLQAAGRVLAVVSNQSGVGRGKFPLERAYATMAQLRRVLRTEGVELDAIRFCPHAPDAGCACRKPGTMLIDELAADLRLSLADSVFVGDKRLDAATGRAMGGAGVLVRTGYGGNEAGRGADGLPGPDAVFDDLTAAAAWILARGPEARGR